MISLCACYFKKKMQKKQWKESHAHIQPVSSMSNIFIR